MPKSRSAYPREFRRRMVELVRAGRTPDSLAKEFEPFAGSISKWVERADADDDWAMIGVGSWLMAP